MIPEPIQVSMPQNWTIPVVFSSPHSGSQYPAHFVEESQLDIKDLRRSEDFAVHELFEAAADFGAPMIAANFPRAFCDVNREPYELDPEMFATPLPAYVNKLSPRVSAGIGTIPRIVSADYEIYSEPLTFEEAQTRLQSCYFPYHHELRRLLKLCHKEFGIALLVDCHSMPGQKTSAENTRTVSTDIVLGNQFGRTCSIDIADHVERHFQKSGFTVKFNMPYAGGYITKSYANPERQIHSLQIEINRDLYMCRDQMALTPEAEKIKAALTSLISSFTRFKIAA